jgi:hypothetical protein
MEAFWETNRSAAFFPSCSTIMLYIAMKTTRNAFKCTAAHFLCTVAVLLPTVIYAQDNECPPGYTPFSFEATFICDSAIQDSGVVCDIWWLDALETTMRHPQWTGTTPCFYTDCP